MARRTRLSNTYLINEREWAAFVPKRREMLTYVIANLLNDHLDAGGEITEFTVEVSPETHEDGPRGVRVGLYGYRNEETDVLH